MASFKGKTILKLGSIGLAALALLVAGWALELRLTGNIHAVDEPHIFRSAQLTPEQLTGFVKEKGIKSIINLRGAHPEERWYRGELEVSERLGLTHEDIALSATHEPDDATLKQLINMMQSAQQPLLIHCQAGADRSGLASALYRLVIKGDDPKKAAEQLSIRYGHFPWAWSRTGAMDKAFWRVVAAPETFSLRN